MSLSSRSLVVATLMLVYAGVFTALAPRLGTQILALGAVHVLVASYLLGLRGGVLVAMLGLPLNTILFNLVGIHGWAAMFTHGGWPGWIAGILVAAAVGRIRDLGRQLEAEVDRRRRIERQKDELVGLIAHDLKNPLAVVVPALDLVASDPGADGDTRQVACDALEAAKRMNRLVLDMIDVRRSEDGALEPKMAEIDVRSLCADVEASVRAQMRRLSQQLVVDVEENSRMRADPELVRRVLVNLLENASKYSPPGSRIRLEGRSTPERSVELRIRDEGPGIPERDRERIFHKYVRLQGGDAADAAGASSRGLGLAFCRAAVDAHRGRIWVEPNEPRGSVFSVRLNAA